MKKNIQIFVKSPIMQLSVYYTFIALSLVILCIFGLSIKDILVVLLGFLLMHSLFIFFEVYIGKNCIFYILLTVVYILKFCIFGISQFTFFFLFICLSIYFLNKYLIQKDNILKSLNDDFKTIAFHWSEEFVFLLAIKKANIVLFFFCLVFSSIFLHAEINLWNYFIILIVLCGVSFIFFEFVQLIIIFKCNPHTINKGLLGSLGLVSTGCIAGCFGLGVHGSITSGVCEPIFSNKFTDTIQTRRLGYISHTAVGLRVGEGFKILSGGIIPPVLETGHINVPLTQKMSEDLTQAFINAAAKTCLEDLRKDPQTSISLEHIASTSVKLTLAKTKESLKNTTTGFFSFGFFEKKPPKM